MNAHTTGCFQAQSVPPLRLDEICDMNSIQIPEVLHFYRELPCVVHGLLEHCDKLSSGTHEMERSLIRSTGVSPFLVNHIQKTLSSRRNFPGCPYSQHIKGYRFPTSTSFGVCFIFAMFLSSVNGYHRFKSISRRRYPIFFDDQKPDVEARTAGSLFSSLTTNMHARRSALSSRLRGAKSTALLTDASTHRRRMYSNCG